MEKKHLEQALALIDPNRAAEYRAIVVAVMHDDGRILFQTTGPEIEVIGLGELVSIQAKLKLMGVLPGAAPAQVRSEDLEDSGA